MTDEIVGDADPTGASVREILGRRLPLGFGDSLLLRASALLARRQVRAIHGLHRIAAIHDPFILALNHSTRREALLVPALLFLHREGRLIHFLSDWNNHLYPGVGLLFSRAGAITVVRKPARPAFLNVLMPLFRNRLLATERARRHLLAGRSVGIFPEGTVNRDPCGLLPARPGMARLALETGIPIIPAGIRFPLTPPGEAPDEHAVMEVHIGAPIRPSGPARPAAIEASRALGATVMAEIGRLSGKLPAAARGQAT